MSLIQHAEKELKLAGLFDKDSDYGGALGSAVMALVRIFSKQGHSGASAHQVISLFKEVASYKNLTPLTGKDDEWVDVSDATAGDDEGCFQNNRVSSVFKLKKSDRAYFLDAITWRTPSGTTWSGSAKTASGEDILSRQYIKEFPFWPKTFIIDVEEKEVAKDDWEFTVKNEADLLPVFEYYNKYTK